MAAECIKSWKIPPVEPLSPPPGKYPPQVAFYNNGLIDPRRGGVPKSVKIRAEKGTLLCYF